MYTQNSYTEAAVVCADSVDADLLVNTTVVFDNLVDVIRTVSPSCEPSPTHASTFHVHRRSCLAASRCLVPRPLAAVLVLAGPCP